MRKEIFDDWFSFQWLVEIFNNKLSQIFNNNVLILIENGSTLGSVDSLPHLSKVEVLIAPPNKTSGLQPLDAVIIAA